MNKGGRTPHPFWKEGKFERKELAIVVNKGLPSEKKKTVTVAYCNYCKSTLQNTAEIRMRKHRQHCHIDEPASDDFSTDNCDDSNKRKNRSTIVSNASESELSLLSTTEDTFTETIKRCIPQPAIPLKKSVSLDSSDNKSTKITQVQKKQNINSFFDTIDEKAAFTTNEALLCSLIESGISLDYAGSKYFLKFCNLLRPAFQPATPNVLLEEYLPKLYLKMKSKSNRSKSGILIISQQKNDSFVCMTLTDEKQYLYVDTSYQVDSFRTFISNAIENFKRLNKSDAHVIISNSVEELPIIEDGREYWYLPCVSKTIYKLLNLLLDSNLRDQVNIIIKEFQEYEKEQELLKRGGELMLHLIDNHNLDFESLFERLRPVFQNFDIMKQIVTENNFLFNNNVILLLIQNRIENDLKRVIETIKFLYEMSHLKQVSATIADVTNNFIKLALKCQNLKNENVTNCLSNVMNPIFLAAHCLHPQYQGNNLEFLKPNYEQEVQYFFIETFNEDEMRGWLMYKAKDLCFKNLIKKGYTSPLTFYKAAEVSVPHFAKVAMKIVDLPAYSAHQNLEFNLQNNVTEEQEKMITELFYILKCNN